MRFYALITAITLLFSACSDSNDDTASQLEVKEYLLEDSKLTPYHVKKQGNKVTIDEHKGKVILIDIFATWCPACKVIAPHLSNLQKKYPDKLLVMGLSIEPNKEHSFFDAFAKAHNAIYPISNAADNMVLAQRIATDLRQPRSFPIPLIVMYDTEGNYFRHYTGAVPEEIIDRDIASALGQK